MTMGTRFACMGTGPLPARGGILPALSFNGHLFEPPTWHDPCDRHETFQRPLSSQTHTKRRSGLRALIKRAHPLRGLPFALGQRSDLCAHLVLPRYEPIPLGDGVEQEVGAHVAFRAGPQLLP